MTEEKIARKIIVRGRVQMVMYRDFAMRNAKRLNLTGFVRNLSDGSVEVVVEGSEGAISKFIEKSKKGPLFARVDSLDVLEISVTNNYKSFEIKY